MVTGQYVDPNAGKVTFSAYFADWASCHVWVNGTERPMSLAANSVQFGDVPLRSIRRSHVEAWVKAETSRGLAPGTIATRYNNVRAVFKAAIRDRVIQTAPPTVLPFPGSGGMRQP